MDKRKGKRREKEGGRGRGYEQKIKNATYNSIG
jgi:hypothetical protein